MRSSLAVLLLVFSASASAEGFDYNYLDLGYGTIEFDDLNVDGDGFEIGGSYAVSDAFHVFVDYNAADLDFNVDATTWDAGFGYNMGLSDTIDLVADLSYEYVEFDVPQFGSADDNGLGLGVGLRFAVGDRLELDAGVKYIDLEDSGDDTGYSLGGLYDFTDSFSLGLSGDWGDNTSAYALNGRFYFGQ